MDYLPAPVTEIFDRLIASPDHVLFAAACAALLIFYVLGHILKRLLLRLLVRARNANSRWNEIVIETIIPPVRFGVRIFGLIVACKILSLVFATETIRLVLSYSGIVYTLLFGWAVLRMIDLGKKRIIERNKSLDAKQKSDITTVAAVAKLLQLVVALIIVLLLMQQLGVDVSGLIAAGGIGGLAIGFAAKDLLANFFGGILLYMERPFHVGDCIRAPSQQGVEGTVEEIGLRMTRLRTFDQRPLYVPNSIFTSIPVENATRMFNRRINISVGVRYDDAESVQGIVNEVRKRLVAMPEIDISRSLIVNFDAFAPSSLDFLVYCFTHATDFTEFHGIKEKVLFMIMQVIDEHGASIAYPTSTIHLQKEPA